MKQIYLVREKEIYTEQDGTITETVTNLMVCETPDQAFKYAVKHIGSAIKEIRDEHNGEIPGLYEHYEKPVYGELLDWFFYLNEKGYGREDKFYVKIEYLDFLEKEDKV